MSRRIVVIDDEEDVVQVIKSVLKSKNYEVFTAGDGEEGLEVINQVKPDLVVLDLMMPKVSGLEVCKRLRSTPEFKDMPILVISALGKDSGKSEEFWKEGLRTDEFIYKPFDVLDLLGRVEYIFRRDSYRSGGRQPEVDPLAEPSPEAEGAASAVAWNDSPTRVVKAFIESWNDQRFGQEYDCLGEVLLGGLSRDEYLTRRHQVYAEGQGDQRRQYCREIIEESYPGPDQAVVVCKREDVVKGRSSAKEERYTLKQTEAGWKIVGVRSK
ncbi:MAG: response regulator [bacterium]